MKLKITPDTTVGQALTPEPRLYGELHALGLCCVDETTVMRRCGGPVLRAERAEAMTQFENACRKAARMLAAADYAVFFGGAGISTDSGLAYFGSRKVGLYNEPSVYGVPAEEILTPAFYEARTAEFFDYYRTKLLNLAAPPNSVHYALAEL